MNTQSHGLQSAVALIGRILLAAALIVQGIFNSILFRQVTQMMNGIEHINGLMTTIIVIQFIAGLLILFGWLTRLGGLLMLVVIIIFVCIDASLNTGVGAMKYKVFTVMMHYTAYAIYASIALYLMAFGAGRVGLDALRRKKA